MEKKKHKKLYIWLAVLVIVLLAVTLLLLKSSRDRNTGTQIPVQAADYQDLSQYITGSGTVRSQSVVAVTSDLTSKITQLNVALGDQVKKGQVLCVFDSTDIQQQIRTLENQISEAQSAVDSQRESAQWALDQAISERDATLESDQQAINSAAAELDTAKANLQEDLAADPQDAEKIAADQQAVKDAQTALSAAQQTYKADAQSLNANVQSAQNSLDSITTSGTSETTAQLDALKQQLAKVTVTAPQDGIVTSLNVSVGSVPSGALMTIQDPKALQVTVNVGEQDILKLAVGQKAVITSDALTDKEIQGTVVRVINFATNDASDSQGMYGESSGATYSADIRVEGQDSGLLLGMNVNAKIYISESQEKLLSVPYDSVAEAEDGTQYVYRAVPVENGYQIEKVTVETGTAGSYYVAVENSDLQQGDLVVTVPEFVTEGQIVQIENSGEEIAAALDSGGSGTEAGSASEG
jgi:HlyD family secretion protein